MVKVKEFLDKNFTYLDEGLISKKDNGHYYILGAWMYTKGSSNIHCNINDESIEINVFISGRLEKEYRLDTYERNTPEEVMEYITEWFQKIQSK